MRLNNKIEIKNKRISNTWWGQQWCKNIDIYSDKHNRLERGREYVRKGTIKAIDIKENKIYALIQGRDIEPYKVEIEIDKLSKRKYDVIYKKLTKKIEDITKLCNGDFPEEFRNVFSSTEDGVFPKINEISFGCSCPDDAIMCKHIAAVLYGIGNLLDKDPLIIFQLRGIDSVSFLDNVLIEKTDYYLSKANNIINTKSIINEDMSEISGLFGIELSNERQLDDKNLIEKEQSNLFDSLGNLKKPNSKNTINYNKNTNKNNKILQHKEKNVIESFLFKDQDEKFEIKKQIAYQIYNQNLSLEYLLDIRKEMVKLNFDEFDIKYVDSLINNELDCIDSKIELEKIKTKLEKYNLDVEYITKLINRKSILTLDKIQNMDKDDLEYLIYDGELSLEHLLKLRHRITNLNFSKEDIKYVDEMINDELDCIDCIDDLNNIKQDMINYKLNTKYIDKLINNKVNNVNNEDNDPLFDKLDKFIESMPMEVLEQIRTKMIEENGDTGILDKAINNKIKIQKQQEEKKQQENKQLRKGIFWGLLSSIFNNNSSKKIQTDNTLMPWEKEVTKNGNYELYQFEEEELEEDDYYNDDLD